MRKSILLVVICVLAFFFTGCDPEKKNPDVIGVNESCNIYANNELIAIVTYIGCAQEELANSKMVLIKETITITPVTKINLDDKDFLLGVGYETYENIDDMYSTDKVYNIEKNQFNIFENEIVEETNYVFCFIVPKEKNSFKYNQVGISFLIFNSYSLVYNFN